MDYREVSGQFMSKAGGFLVYFFIRKPWNRASTLVKSALRYMWVSFLALKWQRKLDLIVIAILIMIPLGGAVAKKWPQKTLVYTAQRVEAAEIAESIRAQTMDLQELEERLDAIVWGGESQGYMLEEGEIYQTFDPNSAEYQSCIRKGGRQPEHCISWGPRQIKMTMIRHYWPILYGETLTDMEYFAIVNSNDGSRRFFLDCAAQVKGCANRWSSATDWVGDERVVKPDVQVYIDLIREIKGISVE